MGAGAANLAELPSGAWGDGVQVSTRPLFPHHATLRRAWVQAEVHRASAGNDIFRGKREFFFFFFRTHPRVLFREGPRLKKSRIEFDYGVGWS